MLPSVQSALNKVDRAIIKWFRKVRPYEGGSYQPVCPICGAVCEYDEDYIEHIMTEEHVRCPNKHYSYSFVTGSTETCVGAVTVYGHYTDTDKNREHKSRIINLAIIHEREEWKNGQEHQANSGREIKEGVPENHQ